jgi:multidrug efflux pump
MQIGWVIAGGMTFGTLLTLFVVPCAYSIIGRKHAQRPGDQNESKLHITKPVAKAAE